MLTRIPRKEVIEKMVEPKSQSLSPHKPRLAFLASDNVPFMVMLRKVTVQQGSDNAVSKLEVKIIIEVTQLPSV